MTDQTTTTQPQTPIAGGGSYSGMEVNVRRGDFVGRDKLTTINNNYYFRSSSAVQDVKTWAEKHKDIIRPYRPGRPYKFEEHPLFAGRDQEIEELINLLEAQNVVLVHGPADSGKSSLLRAGVFPRFVQQQAEVLEFIDYLDVEQALQNWLESYQTAASDEAVAQLINHIEHWPGTFIIFLDNLEQFMDEAADHEGLRTLIRQITSQVSHQRWKIVLAVRSEKRPLIMEDALVSELPHRAAVYEVKGLQFGQAGQAIQKPLHVLAPQMRWEETFLNQQLLPDLVQLRVGHTQQINPLELQIVAEALYTAAVVRGLKDLTAALYQQISDGKGAEQLIAAYLQRELAAIVPAQETRALDLVVQIANQQVDGWAALDVLHVDGLNESEQNELVQQLVEAELLIMRIINDRWRVSFLSETLQEYARRAADPETRRRSHAQEELEMLWQTWLVHDQLPERPQLNTLGRYGRQLFYRPAQALLLLRAAVAHNTPVTPWVEQLRSEDGVALSHYLQNPSTPVKEVPETVWKDLRHAQLLLGREVDNPAPQPLAAWAAASTEPVNQQTAVLTLYAGYHTEAASMVENKATHNLARLWGALADIDAGFGKQLRNRAAQLRLKVWWWRLRRRFNRYRTLIGRYSLAGGIGAGVAIGLWRGLIAWLGSEPAGVAFIVHFPFGFILGAILTVGLLLGRLIMLPPEDAEMFADMELAQRYKWPLIVSGTVAFGLAHVVTILFAGVAWLTPLAIGLGFLAGIGPAIALWDQPEAGSWLNGRWLGRLALVTFFSALVQQIFIAADSTVKALMVVLAGGSYEGQFLVYMPTFLTEMLPNWFHFLATIDAAAVGIVMTLGIALGLSYVTKMLK